MKPGTFEESKSRVDAYKNMPALKRLGRLITGRAPSWAEREAVRREELGPVGRTLEDVHISLGLSRDLAVSQAPYPRLWIKDFDTSLAVPLAALSEEAKDFLASATGKQIQQDTTVSLAMSKSIEANGTSTPFSLILAQGMDVVGSASYTGDALQDPQVLAGVEQVTGDIRAYVDQKEYEWSASQL